MITLSEIIYEFLNRDAVIKRLEHHPEFIEKLLELDTTNKVNDVLSVSEGQPKYKNFWV
jgi:hypothetical protein